MRLFSCFIGNDKQSVRRATEGTPEATCEPPGAISKDSLPAPVLDARTSFVDALSGSYTNGACSSTTIHTQCGDCEQGALPMQQEAPYVHAGRHAFRTMPPCTQGQQPQQPQHQQEKSFTSTLDTTVLVLELSCTQVETTAFGGNPPTAHAERVSQVVMTPTQQQQLRLTPVVQQHDAATDAVASASDAAAAAPDADAHTLALEHAQALFRHLGLPLTLVLLDDDQASGDDEESKHRCIWANDRYKLALEAPASTAAVDVLEKTLAPSPAVFTQAGALAHAEVEGQMSQLQAQQQALLRDMLPGQVVDLLLRQRARAAAGVAEPHLLLPQRQQTLTQQQQQQVGIAAGGVTEARQVDAEPMPAAALDVAAVDCGGPAWRTLRVPFGQLLQRQPAEAQPADVSSSGRLPVVAAPNSPFMLASPSMISLRDLAGASSLELAAAEVAAMAAVAAAAVATVAAASQASKPAGATAAGGAGVAARVRGSRGSTASGPFSSGTTAVSAGMAWTLDASTGAERETAGSTSTGSGTNTGSGTSTGSGPSVFSFQLQHQRHHQHAGTHLGAVADAERPSVRRGASRDSSSRSNNNLCGSFQLFRAPATRGLRPHTLPGGASSDPAPVQRAPAPADEAPVPNTATALACTGNTTLAAVSADGLPGPAPDGVGMGMQARPGSSGDAAGASAGSPGAGAGASGIWLTHQDVMSLATYHEEVTVLFADIKGFTSLSALCHPSEIMLFLNSLFSVWDALLETYGVYKVETIGDAYMCATGLFSEDPATGCQRLGGFDAEHAGRMVEFAKAMLWASQAIRTPLGEPVQVRIGIHSGPCSTGVVGQRCPRFCAFGDTINTASRMESNGVPGCIHVSQATLALVPHEPWQPTGGVFCKGKGELLTYLLPVLPGSEPQLQLQPPAAATAGMAAGGAPEAHGDTDNEHVMAGGHHVTACSPRGLSSPEAQIGAAVAPALLDTCGAVLGGGSACGARAPLAGALARPLSAQSSVGSSGCCSPAGHGSAAAHAGATLPMPALVPPPTSPRAEQQQQPEPSVIRGLPTPLPLPATAAVTAGTRSMASGGIDSNRSPGLAAFLHSPVQSSNTGTPGGSPSKRAASAYEGGLISSGSVQSSSPAAAPASGVWVPGAAGIASQVMSAGACSRSPSKRVLLGSPPTASLAFVDSITSRVLQQLQQGRLDAAAAPPTSSELLCSSGGVGSYLTCTSADTCLGSLLVLQPRADSVSSGGGAGGQQRSKLSLPIGDDAPASSISISAGGGAVRRQRSRLPLHSGEDALLSSGSAGGISSAGGALRRQRSKLSLNSAATAAAAAASAAGATSGSSRNWVTPPAGTLAATGSSGYAPALTSSFSRLGSFSEGAGGAPGSSGSGSGSKPAAVASMQWVLPGSTESSLWLLDTADADAEPMHLIDCASDAPPAKAPGQHEQQLLLSRSGRHSRCAAAAPRQLPVQGAGIQQQPTASESKEVPSAWSKQG